MKRVFAAIAVCLFIAGSAFASPTPDGPHLGWWTPGVNGSTHQYWDMTNRTTIGDAWSVYPDEASNPYAPPGGVGLVVNYDAEWDELNSLWTDDELNLRFVVPNSPIANDYKDAYVALGYTGTITSATMTAYDLAQNVIGQTAGVLDEGVLYFHIAPNPVMEYFDIVIAGTPAMLDWAHIDTICAAAVPAPGAILLGVAGTGLVGWSRRRKMLS